MKETDNNLDSQLWHACAGNMVNMPSINSKVFYFPQGYSEHAQAHVDFATHLRIPSLILCRVLAVKFMADPETDEVFAKIKMVPIGNNELDLDENGDMGFDGSESLEKPSSFAKTLTQSDANNGGGFSVPRYCAETIFPRLDYSADPPVQTIIAKDVHGEIWKFRHIYRGTPRRHLLTTGWSSFVNQKKLVAGDSIVFLRAENGDLCVGIRRAKRGIGFGNDSNESSSGWSSFGGFSMFLKEDENKVMRNGFGNSSSCGENMRGKGKVRVEDVVEASNLAINGQPFEVVYYPRGSTPEFCVKAEAVKSAMRIQWCSGMRFKMPFETEDSSRISWFMGTIASVQVADPIRWPNSPWRLLQVTWDEPDLLQNVKRVSPWLVELVSNMPVVQMSPFSPPKKKLRLLQHPDFTTFDGQFPMPSFSGKPLGPSSPLCYYLADNTPAGIQGARHAQFGISLTDLHLRNKLQPGLCPSSFQLLNQHSRISNGIMAGHRNSHESLSCLLTMGNSSQNLEKSEGVKKHHFLLFGQPILTEQQMSRSSSSDTISQVVSGKDLINRNPNRAKFLSEGSGSSLELHVSPEKSSAGFSWHRDHEATELGLDTGHCKVFMESEDVGRTLDLSTLGSYEELHRRLANMFGIEILEMPSRVIYRDSTGVLKQTGNEPFSEFRKTAKRLTVLTDAHGTNMGRTLIAGIRNAESGLDSSSKAGPLSIFA